MCTNQVRIEEVHAHEESARARFNPTDPASCPPAFRLRAQPRRPAGRFRHAAAQYTGCHRLPDAHSDGEPHSDSCAHSDSRPHGDDKPHSDSHTHSNGKAPCGG